jgi:peptide/nickel transport system substrate-binding protein
LNRLCKPFTDIKMREATAFAVNRKEILTSLSGGNLLAANMWGA